MKPPMIILSGWAYPAKSMQPLADALADHFDIRLVSPHELAVRAAAGKRRTAYAEGLLALLKERAEPCCLLGWSMGGMVALETAAEAPARVAGLILVSTTAKFCSDEDYPCGTPERNLRALAIALKKDPATVLSQFYAESAAPEKLDPAALHARLAEGLALGAETLIRDLRYLQVADFRRAARAIRAPALILHGREDRVIPWQAGQWLCDNLGKNPCVLLDGKGHDLPFRHPRETAREILRFCGAARAPRGLHGKTVRHRFSAAAETYESHATVQSVVAEKLIRLVPPSPTVRRILEVGCGTGILTRHLLGQFPKATIDAIDLSEKMIARASRQFAAAPTIRWQAADAKTFRSRGHYDLIVSNSSLHWIDPLLEGLYNLTSLLKSGGDLVFSLMLYGTLSELHDARLRVAPHKPPLGQLPQLNEVVDNMDLCGCEIREALEEVEYAHYPSAEEFLRTIHSLGLTGGLVSRSTTPLNRSEINRLVAEYEANYRDGGRGLRASYNIGYIKAVRRE